MNTHHHNNDKIADNRPARPRVGRVVGICGLVLFSLISVVIIFIGALSIWLNPERLASLATRQAEKYLNADIHTGSINFTLWSSFPHLRLEIDSIAVKSKTLDALTPAQLGTLPDDAKSLASARRLSGGVNILRLIAGQIVLRDVEVDSLRVNLVAFNDSVCNYNIIRQKDNGPVNIPKIEANYVKITHPLPITYYSAVTKTSGSLSLASAGLHRVDRHKNLYNLVLRGNISANSDHLELLSDFPFTLAGDVGIAFRPFRLSFDDYTINLGNLKGKLNLSMNIGNELKIDRFDYSLSAVNLMKLAQYLPSGYLPVLKRIDADIALDVSARLLKPYKYAPSLLPSLAVDFSVPGGKLTYTVSDNSRYALSDVNMDASFVFDGSDPDLSFFDIHHLDISGYGAQISIGGRINDLTGNPNLNAEMKCNANLTTLGKSIRELIPYNLSGRLNANSQIACTIDGITSDPQLRNISISGSARLNDYSISAPKEHLNFDGDCLDVTFATNAEMPGMTEFDNSDLSFHADGTSVRYADGGLSLRAANLGVDGRIAGKNISPGLPLQADIKAASIRFVDRPDSLNINIKNTTVKGLLRRKNSKYATTLALRGSEADIDVKGNSIHLDGVKAGFRLDPASKAVTSYANLPSAPDSAALSALSHTSEYLSFNAPEGLRRFVDRWDFSGDAQILAGQVVIHGYDHHNYFSNLDASISNDRISVAAGHLQSGTTAASLQGSIGNLHAIICANHPVEIPLSLKINLDTVNINDLAYAYETAAPAHAYKKGRAATQSSDSTALLIPRNIKATIKASAKETVYTNLHLYDLATMVNLAGGRADIPYLDLSSDFGKASLSAAYDTQNIENIEADANISFRKINVVEFFKNFHTLLLMMPQMENLSGFISADASIKMPLFPTMFVNSPAFTANVDIEGEQLKVHQTKFIRHITRMMLIRTGDDLHIADMKVHADVHDNLLELFPFNFEFDRYKIAMNGINNFNGDLYYHIGILKSPVPFPFGINVEGEFHHPRIRFGGAHYDDKKAWEITENVGGKYRINLTGELRYYMKEFVHKAAQAALDPTLSL